jgi:hypothetical protein
MSTFAAEGSTNTEHLIIATLSIQHRKNDTGVPRALASLLGRAFGVHFFKSVQILGTASLSRSAGSAAGRGELE